VSYRPEELLAVTLAARLAGLGHVAVGASSPIPGAAALLERERSGGRLRVSLLGSTRHSPFTDGGRELFDCAAQGRIDAFFLGGGQIDGQGNLNLVGVGGYPRSRVRFPGSFGSAFMYFVIPRVLLFTHEHSRRVLVERVEFISAPGVSPPGVWRRGGPELLLTPRCLFTFERERGGFSLASVHPGHGVEEVREHTGFRYREPPEVPETAPPEAADLAVLRGPVAGAMRELYPRFAARVWPEDR